MTRSELTALGDQIKALAAERDRLVVRREGLLAEWCELWEQQLEARDSSRQLVLDATAIHRDVGDHPDLGLEAWPTPRLDADGSPDARSYVSARSETSAARERARPAA